MQAQQSFKNGQEARELHKKELHKKELHRTEYQKKEEEKDHTILFARIQTAAELPAIQHEVEQLLCATWIDHVNRRDYSGVWDVLPLRCQHQHRHAHPILQGFSITEGDEWENLPALIHSPALLGLLNNLHCPVKSARLMRLKAGAEIKPHRDRGLAIEYGEARLHLPIYTSDAVSFLVNNQLIPMRAGELWYFNADEIHEVHNRGDEDRINLVIDCIANEWLCTQIQQGGTVYG